MDYDRLMKAVERPGMTPIVTSTCRYKPLRARLLWMIPLIVLAAMAPAAADDVPEPQFGTYVCVTDRAVGFQGGSTSNGKERFAGNIRLPPEYQRFFVTLRKIALADHFTVDGWLAHPPGQCFSDQVMKRLQGEWENNGNSVGHYEYPDIRNFQQQCLATSEVQIKAGATKWSYYGIGNNIFTNELADRFWIYSNGGFVWHHTNDNHDQYLLEGRCDLVK
jgi:hypothetical protein